MIKTLRRKFILISMLLVFVVMTVVLAAGLISNQLQFQRDYESALRLELAVDQHFKLRQYFPSTPPTGNQRLFSPRLTFTAIKWGEEGWELRTPWVEVDEHTLQTISSKAMAEQESMGFWSDLGLAYARGDGRIAFINLQNEQAQLNISQWTWTLTYLAALGVFFLLSILLSRWTLRPVERAWQQQQRFVSDASHELRTPLTVILANLDILESEQGNNLWLNAARTEGLMMKKLIENLLFLAHADESLQGIPKQALSLSDLASEMALAYEALAFEKKQILDINIQANLKVQGDKDLLRQLLGILLDNAVKYTPEGGRITVEVKMIREKPQLSIRNTPAYIEKDHLDHLFDRFYRQDSVRNKSEGGYGLGLSIAAEIARQHGANLKVQSNLEDGTCFIVGF